MKEAYQMKFTKTVESYESLNGSHVVLQFSSPVNRGYCFRIQF